MANIKYNIYKVNADNLAGYNDVSTSDGKILSEVDITKTFNPANHFIELTYFTLDDVELNTFPNYKDYSILSGDTLDGTDGNTEISINVEQDYLNRGYETEEVKALYSFFNYVYSDSFSPQDFYIESVSPDRKELRLISVDLDGSSISEVSDKLIDRYENDAYIPELYLYFENNFYLNIVNLQKEQFRNTTSVLIKLYDPLPKAIENKVRLNIVEKVSDPVAYEINTTIELDEITIPYLRGPNFSVEIDNQNVEPSKYFNYNELFSFPVNNTYRQLNSLFSEKGAELGIDYSDFSYFLNFSSAEERLRNFKYKLDLIESHQNNLDVINETSNNYSATGITGSRNYYEGLIEGLLNNFDHYERHLYYESGSTSWPKVENSTVPFVNQLSTTEEATTFFNAEIQDAVLFDAQNQNLLANTIPSFLREDSDNRPYEIFIHMIAQHFDNLWIYTDAVSKKYDADNRLNRGVSKDLVEELLKNFGVKLYTSNRSLQDLFRYFTFDSYDLGSESSATIQIAQPDKPLSQNDYQKSIYKRIYHNLSLLMKSKGTERGLRALINCFGIPSDILKIKIFGGQNAYDLPYFGGEQQFTGSIDKVRLNNTGSIVPGNTISYYTSILNYSNDYTQDLHRIEVGFSPSDNIDSYIVSQSAVLFPNDPFNIDQYIGDPRQSLTNRYEDLEQFTKTIFEGVTEYDVKDFVRLIKFFDNVIFRMIKDFTPARAITDSGIIIKSHLLDRNKVGGNQMTWTRNEYTGSIKTAFFEGGNAGIFGTGLVESNPDAEYSTDYLKITRTPSGSKYRRVNEFNNFLADEIPQVEKMFGETKFDGEFQNSFIRVSNGELNEDNPYKQIDYPTILYDAQFYNTIPDNICILTQTSDSPFPVEPDVIINIPNTNIFTGDTPTAYTFTVDGDPPNQGDGFNHIFDDPQYTQLPVTATNNDTTIVSSITGEECSAERNVVIVKCDINTNNGSPINPMGLNTPYNLFNFFFDNLTLNTDLTFFVNGENVGNISDGNTNLTHTITDSALSQVFLEVQDSFDPSCKKQLALSFTSCPLVVPDIGRTGTMSELDLDGLGAAHFPFGINGITPTTELGFELYILYSSEGYPSFNNYENAFISNKVLIENPLPENSTNTISPSIFSSVPTNYAGIVNKFRNQNVGSSTVFVNYLLHSTNGLDPFNSNVVDPNNLLTNDHDPYLFSTLGIGASNNPFVERNYKRYIRFIADNGEIDGQPCTVTSNFYLIDGSANQHRLAVTMLYDNLAGAVIPTNTTAYTVCTLSNPEEVTVYAQVGNTVNEITPVQVLSQAIPIYKYQDMNNTSRADAGAYFMEAPETVPAGQWRAGRRGRLWRPYLNGQQILAWDTFSSGLFPQNAPTANSGQLNMSTGTNLGYFFCTTPGNNNPTDGGGGNESGISDGNDDEFNDEIGGGLFGDNFPGPRF